MTGNRLSLHGGCRCGGVRYTAALDRLPPVYACHCPDCQTWSGSAFSLQFLLSHDRLEVVGATTLFTLTSQDGQRISRQHACPICFTILFNTNTRHQNVVLRAGTLDRSDELTIVVEPAQPATL